jgi:hypothetical protein
MNKYVFFPCLILGDRVSLERKPPLPSSIRIPKYHTYDSKINPMLGGNLRRRFDRCLVFHRNAYNNNHDDDSNNKKKNSVCSTCIGTEAIPSLTFAKFNCDHFGLVTRFSLD